MRHMHLIHQNLDIHHVKYMSLHLLVYYGHETLRVRTEKVMLAVKLIGEGDWDPFPNRKEV
jgi:hypothetical protein